MNTNTYEPNALFGSGVAAADNDKIGTVDSVWVDDATGELEFIGVKTGWLFGKTHIIPCANAEFSGDGDRISVPYGEEQIKNAPSYDADAELSANDEEQIYSYYGIDRTTAPSSSGLPGGEHEGHHHHDHEHEHDHDHHGEQMTLHEEELEVGKRQVHSGQVRLRKVVHTEHEEVPVELRREEIDIERVPVTDTHADHDHAFRDQEIEVDVTREEPVVGKNMRATEQVRLHKDVETETRTVGGDVRSEEVEIDRDTETADIGGTGYAETRRDRTDRTDDSGF